MKKAKILAFTLTLAMLLSALLVPVSAFVNVPEETYSSVTSDTDITANILDTETIGDYYQESAWGASTVDGVKDEKDAYVDHLFVTPTLGHKRGASDATTATFHLWYSNDANHLYFYMEVNGNDSKISSNELARLHVDFYNQHSGYNATAKNPYTTFVNTASPYTGGALAFDIPNGTASNYRGAPLDHLTEYKVVTNGGKFMIEGKLELPGFINRAIEEDKKQPVIGVGQEVRVTGLDTKGVVTEYCLGYFDTSSYPATDNGKDTNEFGTFYDNATLYPDLVLATENSEILTPEDTANGVLNVTDVEFNINGTMDDGEGWASVPYVSLNDRFGSSATAVNDTDGRIYLSTDGENLYAYISSDLPQYTTYFYVQLDSSVNKATNSVSTMDRFAEFTLYPSGAKTSTLEHTKDIAYTTEDGSTIGKTIYKFNEDGTGAEIKMPLPESVKTALQTGDFTFKIGSLIRTANAANSSYTAQTVSYDYGFDWNNGTIPVTLPQTVAETSSEVQVEGFQSREDGETDIRFVSSLKGNWEDYEALGFEFTYEGQTAIANCKYVYESLKAGEGVLDPASYDADYFFCYTILNLEAGDYTFAIRSWTQKEGEAKEYSASVEYSFTVNSDGSVTVK